MFFFLATQHFLYERTFNKIHYTCDVCARSSPLYHNLTKGQTHTNSSRFAPSQPSCEVSTPQRRKRQRTIILSSSHLPFSMWVLWSTPNSKRVYVTVVSSLIFKFIVFLASLILWININTPCAYNLVFAWLIAETCFVPSSFVCFPFPCRLHNFVTTLSGTRNMKRSTDGMPTTEMCCHEKLATNKKILTCGYY